MVDEFGASGDGAKRENTLGFAGRTVAAIAGTVDGRGRKSDAGGAAHRRWGRAYCGDGDAGRDSAGNSDAERIERSVERAVEANWTEVDTSKTAALRTSG
jgi:hypothetical protein